MIRFLVEAAIAIAISIVVALLAGVHSYALVAGACTFTMFCFIIAREDNLERTLGWVAMSLVMSCVLGAIWPALPVILFHEHRKRAATKEPAP